MVRLGVATAGASPREPALLLVEAQRLGTDAGAVRRLGADARPVLLTMRAVDAFRAEGVDGPVGRRKRAQQYMYYCYDTAVVVDSSRRKDNVFFSPAFRVHVLSHTRARTHTHSMHEGWALLPAAGPRKRLASTSNRRVSLWHAFYASTPDVLKRKGRSLILMKSDLQPLISASVFPICLSPNT